MASCRGSVCVAGVTCCVGVAVRAGCCDLLSEWTAVSLWPAAVSCQSELQVSRCRSGPAQDREGWQFLLLYCQTASAVWFFSGYELSVSQFESPNVQFKML